MSEVSEDVRFLSVKNLVVEYTIGGEVIQAVNGVSFDLEKGKTLALVGETGAGKTTIAKSILRILPDPPAIVRGGEVLLRGTDLMKLKSSEMRKVRGKTISMIFQDPMTALNPTRRVGDQIREGIKQHNQISSAEAQRRACDMLNLVGIGEDRAADYPHQLSGGMKQRVVIAIALACSPELLLADEPTTALDVTIQAQVMEVIKGLREKLNTSMIMISHDLGVVAGISDYVAVVYAGEIIEYGSLEDLFDRPDHPYTIGLFNSLPSLSKDEDRLSPIPGLPPDPRKLPKGCSFSPRCPFVTEECILDKPKLSEIGPGHITRCFRPGIASRKGEGQ